MYSGCIFLAFLSFVFVVFFKNAKASASAQSPSPSHTLPNSTGIAILSSYTTTSTVNSSSAITPTPTSTVKWYGNATVWDNTTSTVNSSSTITQTPTSTVQWFVNVTAWNTTTSSAITLTPSTTVRSASTSVITTTSTPWPTAPPSYNQTTPTEPQSTTPAISTTAPTTTPGPDPIMYPYGVEANDLQDTADYYYWTCPEVQLDMRGIAFFGRRHFKLYICRNGLISFNHRWYRRWPYNFGQRYWFDSEAILAPYWALIDRRQAFREGVSKLFYHLYKEGDSDPATRDILSKATEDVNKHMRYNPLPTEFTKPTFVLVVTWVKIRHWYSEWRADLRNKCNTFQAVLITDSVYAFVMYNYPANGIQWSAPADREDYSRYWNDKGLPVVGLNAGDKKKIYYNHPRSGRVNILDIDRIDGLNVFKSSESTTSSLREALNGMRGRIFIRLEDSPGLEDARLKCVTWYYQQGDPRAFTQSLEPCPCTEWQARRDRRFRITTWDRDRVCYYSQFPSSEGWGQECCYKLERVRRWWGWWSWIEYLANGYPDGGNAHRFHKYRYPKEYEKDDKHAYEHCCIHSNMCWMYQEARPSDTCSRYIPPRWSWFWGDPHFVTLDGMNYTFNGLGEYVMLDAKDDYFQLQARTKIAKGEGTATVFSGAVAKERNTSTVQVTLADDNGTMEVMVDGKIFDIQNLTNISVALDGSVSISKPERRCFEMSFPSGMSVKTCEKHQQLSIIAAAPNSFKNTTKGLLGTWNGHPIDDFTLPNGTILPHDMSGRDVHYKFGLAWQVTNKTSLFTYKEGESFATFLNESFSPMFVEDLKFANASLKEEAEKLCQGDVSCLFDAVSTQDLEVGLSTKQLGSQLVNDSKKMSNEPPKISNRSAVIELLVNTTAIVIVEVTDADGDTIFFNVSGLPPDGVVSPLNSSFWKITWFVTTKKLDLQFTATAGDAVSVLQPKIYLCACHHGGNCEKPSKITGADSGEQKFVIMTCSCVSGYTGTYCEADIDACEANLNPCYPRVTCIDLPPPANMTDGYKCGPCPTGYTGNGASCTDIDECSVNNGGCSQLCGNTPGSYVCSCMNGYQLKADKKSCDDIDECYLVSDCMQKCINTPGSYNCSCNENFKIDPAKPKLCVPKNPCQDGDENGCDQVCYLVDNERKCACNKGYELKDDQKSCRDVDECAAKKSRCNQKCHNQIGSYTCSCLHGFVLSSDSQTCVDINECMKWTFNCTDSSQLCVNTDGSYKCECEEGLYLIDNKCKGLNRGQTPPLPPPAPDPKTPNQNETLNAVNITMRNFNVSEWNKPREDKFKEVIAEATTSYCSKTDSECSVKVMRVRRSTEFITWTEDEIHRMPGFPIQIVSEKYPASSLVARLAFYVNFPRSVMLQTGSTLSNDIVLQIVNASRGAIENALNASIIEWSIYKEKPEEEEETSKEKKDMLPIIIGASVGGTLFILLIVVIVIIFHKREQRKVNHQSPPEDIQMRIAVLAAVNEGVEQQQPDYYNYPLRARPVKFLRE